MGLKDSIKRHMVIATAAVSLTADAMTTPIDMTMPVNEPVAQKAVRHSILDDIRTNKKITYNGLSFDTPLFHRKQRTNATLADFDFHFNGNETGISVKEGRKTFLVLMPKETLETLISALIAKDTGEQFKSTRPENPEKWVFRSQFPEILVVENGTRRSVRDNELPVLFEKAVSVLCACNAEEVINAKKIVKTYAERVGGAAGKTLSVSMDALFMKRLQNTALTKFANAYKDDVVASLKELPQLRAEEKRAFDLEKGKKLTAYLTQKEQERLIAQEEAKKELARKESLIAFNHISNVKVEKYPGQSILLFNQDNHEIEINVGRSIFSNVSTYDAAGERVAFRELEPEEWKTLQQMLPKVLTTDQKQQIGTQFFEKLNQKAAPQLIALAAAQKAHL